MKNDFRPAIVTTWSVTGLCLLAFGLMYVLSLFNIDWRDDWFFLVFAFPIFLCCIVFLPLLYNMRSKYKEDLIRIERENPLAHWIYRPDEWNHFNRNEWKRTRKKTVTIPAGFLLIIAVIALLDKDITTSELNVAAPWIIGFFTLLSFFLFIYTYRLYRRTTTCPKEVIIGTEGVSYGGYYTTWNIIGANLGNVRYLPGDPAVVEFEILTSSRYGSRSAPLRVPVPKGLEIEAERLAKEFIREEKRN